MHNKQTGKYLLWMHIDSSDYGEAKIGVAIGDSVCGKYTYVRSEQPLGFQSRDSGVFVDDDGKGYLLTEDVRTPIDFQSPSSLTPKQRQNGLRINALSDTYLNVTKNVYVWKEKYESPALIKRSGVYFMFASQLTGWNPNDNYYSTATSLSGPWSSWQKFADSGSNTYASQTTFVLPIGNNNYVYMGDRWVSSNLMRSTYIWLPLTLSGTTASMKNAVNWMLDPTTGTATAGPTENAYEGESATLANGAKSVSCTGCSGGAAAGYIGGPTVGAATFSNAQSDATTRTTLRIKHLDGDNGQRYASVVVNGKAQKVAFLPNGGSDPGSSVVHVDLKSGGNVIQIAGVDGGWGPDVDRVFVPVN